MLIEQRLTIYSDRGSGAVCKQQPINLWKFLLEYQLATVTCDFADCHADKKIENIIGGSEVLLEYRKLYCHWNKKLDSSVTETSLCSNW